MESSYKQILRSSSIIGGASIIGIIIGLIRTKAVAVILGPAGVGLLGLYQSMLTTAATVSAMGLGVVGTRQVAEAVGQGDRAKLDLARRTLFWTTICAALSGTALFLVFRRWIAEHLIGEHADMTDVTWMALGVLLTVAAGSQSAFLNGMRQIRFLALITINSALISTLIGVTALAVFGKPALFSFLVLAPLASLVLGHYYVQKLQSPAGYRFETRQLAVNAWRLMRLGSAFMLSAIITSLAQLLVRSIVQKELGSTALGNFQAASAISMTYIGVVLAAMGTDYYPRLTAAINNAATARQMVNEQTEIALLISAPIFLLMLTFAPLAILLLYSTEFGEAVQVLRVQIIGDILKVAGWPLGFVILARGDGKTFLLVELISAIAFVGITLLSIDYLGLQGTSIAFVIMYAALLPMVYLLAKRSIAFKWNTKVKWLFALLLVAASLIMAVSFVSEWGSIAIGCFCSVFMIAFSTAQLGRLSGASGAVGKLSRLSHTILAKIGINS
jgi:PST family polysaccharide transporter